MLIHIKTTGTRGSGSSVAGDWSDANCYADFLAALTVVAGDGSSHTFIFYDETHLLTNDVRTRTFFNVAAEQHYFQSRNGDPEQCTLVTAQEEMFRLDNNTFNSEFHFSGMRLSKSGATGGSASAVGLLLQYQQDNSFTMTDMILGPITVDNPTASPFALINGNANTTAVGILDNVRTEGVVYNANPEQGVFAHLPAGSKLELRNGCKVQDIDVNHNRAGQFRGVLYANDGVLLADDSFHLFSDINLDNRDSLTGAPGNIAQSVVNLDTNGAAEASIVHRMGFRNIHLQGGLVTGFGVRTTGRLDFGRLFAENCSSEPEVSGLDGGRGLLYVHETGSTDAGRAALAIGDRVEAVNCEGSRGGLIYSGGGGQTFVKNAFGTDITVEGAAVYSGGDGDFRIDNVELRGTRYKQAGDDEQAMLFNCIINNPLTGNTSKHFSIGRFRGSDNVDLSGANHPMAVISGNEPTTFNLTAMLDNIELANNGASENLVLQHAQAATNIDVLISNSSIEGGVVDEGVNSLQLVRTDDSGILPDQQFVRSLFDLPAARA